MELIKTGTLEFMLLKLQEEASEVIQAVSKIRRFGPDNTHPDRQQTNKQELIGELEDFLALVGALEHLQYFDLTLSHSKFSIDVKKPPNLYDYGGFVRFKSD